MRIFGFCFLPIFLLVLFACSESSTSSPDVPEDSAPFGWLDGDFTPVTDFSRGGGLQKIAHSGDWIVLEDAWTGPVDSGDALFGNSTYTPRLFISKIGSDSWDTIKPPTKSNIKSLYADSQGIYVGMYASAEVFEYSPSKKSWKQFKLKDSLQAGEWYSVYGIGRFQNRLIVSIAGYQRIASDANGKVASFVKWKNASGWEDVDASPRLYSSTAKDDFSTEPFHFHKGFEWKGKFYAATIDGVWRLDATGSTWTKLPDVPKLLPFTRDYATNPTGDFVLHKNQLYVTSVLDETIFALNENESSWLQVDSLFFDGDTAGTMLYSIRHNTPGGQPLSLVSSGEHLFIAGNNPSIPMVYMGDYGEPYGNIPKGWRKVGSWCAGLSRCLFAGGTTYSMDVVGDTLYVANWKNLLKFPLDKLDFAIANEKDFW